MKEFGNKIKALRRKMNLTQEELAERLNVSFQAISNDVKRELKYIEENQCYSGVRNEKWYKDIINKYQSFASNTKK